MADLIDRNTIRKMICSACSERLQCTDMGNVCFEVACINNAPKIETAPKWIPCSERLPEQSGVYFVYFTFDDGSHAADISYINVGSGLGHITHWMPIPLLTPPDEKGDETR